LCALTVSIRKEVGQANERYGEDRGEMVEGYKGMKGVKERR
jgi:hypothetical protein